MVFSMLQNHPDKVSACFRIVEIKAYLEFKSTQKNLLTLAALTLFSENTSKMKIVLYCYVFWFLACL
jgi:hypothetical protein